MISKIKDWIISKSTIDKVLKFNGDLVKFSGLLNSTDCKDKFYVTQLENNKFEITDKSSVGIMIMNGYRAVRGITAFGSILSANSDNLTIRLKTKIRIEIYLCCLITIVSLVAMIINIGKIPFWPFLFPIILIPWFNWIYMIQNRGLMEKISRHFDLKK